jgi:hypothetical protein
VVFVLDARSYRNRHLVGDEGMKTNREEVLEKMLRSTSRELSRTLDSLKTMFSEAQELVKENKALRDRLAQPEPQPEEVPCKTHPDAPHGFDRNASHSADRYVCECESWEPPEPEPVAWGMPREDGVILDVICPEEHAREEGGYTIPLYTAPPKREWVGLTDEEAKKTFEEHNCVISADLAGILARAIEAALEEKNCG